MTIDENDRIVDTYDDQYVVKTDHNQNYVDISSFGLKNAPDTSSNNEWREGG